MSIKQMTFVFNDETLKGNEKLLMLAVADNCNDSGVAFPSWSELMRKTSMSKGSISKWFTELENKNLLFRKARNRKNGSRTSNKFLIYPHINKAILDEEDMLIFEDLFIQSSEVELQSKVQKLNTPCSEVELQSKVQKLNTPCSEVELPNGGQSSEVEHLEPSLTSLTTTLTTTIVTDENISVRIANYLLNHIMKSNPTFKNYNIKSWAKDIELAMRIDKRTPEQLKQCIDWIYGGKGNGSFWIPNILSGKKLREKFDTMNMQVISKPTNQKDTIDDIYDRGLTATEVIAEMVRREENK